MRSRAVSKIGRAEMRVLAYVQQQRSVTVRQATDHFAAAEGVSRTTVLNVLVRLWRKKYLNRRKHSGGGHLYSPREPRPNLLRRLVGEFVGDVLGGSVSPFVAYLSDRVDQLSEAERIELAELLKQLQQKEAP